MALCLLSALLLLPPGVAPCARPRAHGRRRWRRETLALRLPVAPMVLACRVRSGGPPENRRLITDDDQMPATACRHRQAMLVLPLGRPAMGGGRNPHRRIRKCSTTTAVARKRAVVVASVQRTIYSNHAGRLFFYSRAAVSLHDENSKRKTVSQTDTYALVLAPPRICADTI